MVYVDAPIWPFRGMLMCHLLADTVEELHEFAARLGLKPGWYQGPPVTKTPHCDICKTRRAKAIKLGAVEVLDRRQVINIMRKLRGEPAR